jgi:hypothetical protein
MRDKKMWLQSAFILVVLVLLLGWRYQQANFTSWEYKIVPVNAMTAGEGLLKEMDAQGWELITVQALRTQADLAPRAEKIQAQTSTAQLTPPSAASAKSEALYFFRRAKRK